jgi:hypothetical protein
LCYGQDFTPDLEIAMPRALVVRGGWEGHTPVESTDIFITSLKDQGCDVIVADTLDAYLDENLMSGLDLINQMWTMGRITDDQWHALNRTVAAGCGFAGWHGGVIDSFRQNTEYQFMTGGQWVAHPGNCIPEYTVNVTDPTHPITRDIGAFKLADTEQYYCHVDPGVHVLCTTTFSGAHGDPSHYPANTVMPYAWTRTWGKGRIFVAAWGHTCKDFDVPEAMQIVSRGLKWATR